LARRYGADVERCARAPSIELRQRAAGEWGMQTMAWAATIWRSSPKWRRCGIALPQAEVNRDLPQLEARRYKLDSRR